MAASCAIGATDYGHAQAGGSAARVPDARPYRSSAPVRYALSVSARHRTAPCCAARDRRDSPASSPASAADRRHRAQQRRSWDLLPTEQRTEPAALRAPVRRGGRHVRRPSLSLPVGDAQTSGSSPRRPTLVQAGALDAPSRRPLLKGAAALRQMPAASALVVSSKAILDLGSASSRLVRSRGPTWLPARARVGVRPCR
jgi:hypothetical protein